MQKSGIVKWGGLVAANRVIYSLSIKREVKSGSYQMAMELAQTRNAPHEFTLRLCRKDKFNRQEMKMKVGQERKTLFVCVTNKYRLAKHQILLDRKENRCDKLIAKSY